ncbi:hypothetical protein [Streptomyces wuyuanensis]|uniref:hypothetical protein n=1 Tax=Streptomyces wuyuanensis TaxID=1196353 RepID=UPI0036B36EFA
MTSDDHRRDRPARAPSRRALTAWRSAARPPSSGSARGRRTTGTNATHACIGRMYASEPGSARHHDAVAPGLARPGPQTAGRDLANAGAHGVDPGSAAWE